MLKMEESKLEREKLNWEREERLRQQRLEKYKLETNPQYKKLNQHYIDQKTDDYVVSESYID